MTSEVRDRDEGTFRTVRVSYTIRFPMWRELYRKAIASLPSLEAGVPGRRNVTDGFET